MSEKPFLSDAIIGNGQSLVTMGRNGRFYRYFWPTIGAPQHLQDMQLGIKSSRHYETSWIHDHHWHHEQQYLAGTNIIKTTAVNTFLGVSLVLCDYVFPDNDVIVRDIIIQNLSEEKQITLLNYSSFYIDGHAGSNGTFFEFIDDMLVHYRQNYYFGIGSEFTSVTGYQCGNHSFNHASQGTLIGGDIGMAPEGCLAWDMGSMPGGSQRKITLYICPGTDLQEVKNKMKQVRTRGAASLLEETGVYWQNYLKKGVAINSKNARLNNVYERSLLVFGLLSDKNTGAILAAPEIDEGFCKCGGYGFCWGRDAAFITIAMDKAGYHDLARNFYNWAVRVQAINGAWLQRYHIDGSFAPSWGIQIDETGSILWGMWQHYLFTGNLDFLVTAWPSIEKAVNFLIAFLDPETGLPRPSYDLWEERKGEHAYSAAAVFGGFQGAIEIAKILGREQQAVEWEQVAKSLKEAIINVYWDVDKQAFCRTVKLEVGQGEYSRHLSSGCKVGAYVDLKGYVSYQIWSDDIPDISLLGLTEPFEVISANDQKMQKTAVHLLEKLSINNIGGLKRYENDSYIGGNPWIITTLWMALYKIKLGNFKAAEEMLNWALDHSTELYLLPEQVDKNSGAAAWVVPLTWSHAMFVLVALELKDKGQLL